MDLEVVNNDMSGPFVKHLGELREHPLSTRRYMGVVEY